MLNKKSLKEKFLKLFKSKETSASEGETSTKTPTEAEEISTTAAGNVGTKKKTTDFATKYESEVVCKKFSENLMSVKMRTSENECAANVLLKYLQSEQNINFVFFDELLLRDTYYQKRGRHDLELLKDCSELTSIEGMWLCLHRDSALDYSEHDDDKRTSFEATFKIPNLPFNLRNPQLIQEQANTTLRDEEKSEIKIPPHLFKGLQPKVHTVSKYEEEVVMKKMEESLNLCKTLTIQEETGLNKKILIILGDVDDNEVLVKKLLQTTKKFGEENKWTVNAHLSEEQFLKPLKEFIKEKSEHNILPSSSSTSSTTTRTTSTLKMEIKNGIGEDPRDFVFNNKEPCIAICDFALSEGYECPSVIAFYGYSDTTVDPQWSDNNITNRSVANLIVFQEPK